MLLSSLRRLRLFCSGQSETLITNSVIQNRILGNWLGAVSKDIESYLNRELHVEARTEYYDVDYRRMQYWINAYPIITLTDVYEDSTGLFAGSETEIEDCINMSTVGRVVLPYMLSHITSKSLRIRYTGGLAYDAVQSIFLLAAGASTTWAAGKYVVGMTSGAVGLVISYSTLLLTIEQYYGQFQIGEVVKQYDDEAVTPTNTSVTGTIASFTRESLLNSHPNIVLACEIQVRYMRQHQLDFENSGTQKDGVTIRNQNPLHLRFPLREEVINMIYEYTRTWGE